MKRLSIFFAALMACTLSFAETVTFDATKDKAGTPVTTLTKDGITLTIGDGTLANGSEYRVYANQSFKVSSTIGNMTSVEFTCTANGITKYGPGCMKGDGYVAGSAKVGTWTGDAEEFTLKTTAQVRATKIVVTYTPAAADVVKKPTFTPADGDFVGSVEVTLAAEEGLDIYYTLDGTDPTTTSTKYAAPFTLTETTTVKAIAYNATASKASAVAEKTYTAQKLMTCAEANAAANGTTIMLGEVTVAYVNGANIYVKDETGYTLVFKYDFGLKAGQVVKGLKGSMSIFNGLPEIVPSVTVKDLTVTDGTIPEPILFTTVPTKDDVNKYILIKSVKFDNDYKAYKSKTNANVLVGETKMVVRNNFTIDFGDLMKAYTYDITGFVAIYNGTIQFYPIAINDITMHGNYTIGILDGCDYASLAEAFTAYNNYAKDNMVSGDVTFQVATNLAEPKNVGLQNPTDYTVTLTVDKAEARTISFSQAGDNAGPSGNICIGCDMTLTHTCASVETKNVVLDGSFNGSEENYLTIKSVAGCHKLNGPVLVYGNVKNTTIKNCNLIAENGVGSSIYPITIRSQKNEDFAPENIVVDGNYIEANKGTADQGIYFQLTTDGKVKPANVTISNNEIVARTRGIFMSGINGATIKNNIIKINQTATGMLSYGIWGFKNTEGEFNIEGNMIQELSTSANVAEAGIYGIVANAGKWYIRNNYVSGFNVLATAADNIAMVGIQGASAADTVVIEHNTVAMAEQTNKVANASAAKICLIKAVSGKASVKNNLVVSNEAGFANALVSPAGIMENNVYCTKSYLGSADSIKALVDYKTIHEATAKSVESVVFENLAQGILDLAGASDGDANLGVKRLAEVTTDIYGTERAEFTYAGAFEGKAIEPGPGTDVEDIDAAGAEVQKIIRNGQVLIIRDGKTYNMMGQIVE